jgi:hypothetical protein
MTAKSFPADPVFADPSEREVWQILLETLPSSVSIICGLRIHEFEQEYELDFTILWPNVGVSVLEVKGGNVVPNEDSTFTQRDSRSTREIDPITQVTKNHYALKKYIEDKSSLRHVGIQHFLVFPYSEISTNYNRPNIPRKIIADSLDLPNISSSLEKLMLSHNFRPSEVEVEAMLRTLGQAIQSQLPLSKLGDSREHKYLELTEQQYKVLDLCKLMRKFAILGAAGCGKTFVAIEQAKRRARLGDKVLFLCYNRGLSEHVRRQLIAIEDSSDLIQVATLHSLPSKIGIEIQPSDDDDYWDLVLPTLIEKKLLTVDKDSKYDTVIIDEAQDFHPLWWKVVTNLLKNPESGAIFAFGDTRQGVFRQSNNIPIEIAKIHLDTNMRNALPIARLAAVCVEDDLNLAGLDGPSVRFVESTPNSAIEIANQVLIELINEGWRSKDICLLTTGSRHPLQLQRIENTSRYAYWDSFFDTEEIFYSHVLGFKGLERPVIVVAINGWKHEHAKKDLLYTSITRARDLLVICGSTEDLRQAGGKEFLKSLARTQTQFQSQERN